MSTSDETQRGTAGARTTTSPRDDSGPGPEQAPVRDGSGGGKPRRGGAGRATPGGTAGSGVSSGTTQRGGTPAASTSAGTSAGTSARTSAGTSSTTSAKQSASKGATTSKPAGSPRPGSRGSGSPAPGSPAPGSPAPGTPGPGSPAAAAAASKADTAATARPAAPRRVRLTVARLDPWSVMKLSFLLSVALGIAFVVASGVLWSILDGMGVYTDVSRVVGEIIGDGSFDLTVWAGFGRTLSLVTVLAVVNVVLLTAISTLGAFLYNISAALVGGLHVTLSDD